MNGIYQHYIIDMSSNNNFVQVPTVQGDGNGVRGFEVELIQNGVPYEIDADDVIISIMGTKPDTTGIFNECSLTDEGYILVDITSQMSAVKGRGDYEIVLMSRSKNSQLKSFPFFIITTPSALDIDYLISSDEFQTLTKRIIECDQALEDMQELEETVTANENERISNENTRQQNELTRQDNEDTRKSNETQRQKNEQERQSNEDIRKVNEERRIANEDLRKEAENVREANELVRQDNESVREQNEQDRKDNEIVREANENERITNELDRISSEEARESNEAIREDNEETRQQNEAIRQQKEQYRDDTELERQTNEEQRKANEEARENSEAERNTNEAERIAAENVRKSNEEVRESNESLREDSEKERKSAEVDRKKDEAERQLAESNRVDAENARQTNELNRQNAEIERQETFESLEQNMNEGLDKLDVTNETAKNYADMSKSYAVGTDGEARENDDIDNAKYYYEQTLNISQGINGIIPMGNITFDQLALIHKEPGYMFNVTEDFVTDDTFNCGAGKYFGAGNNVIWTAQENWDVTAASTVTGTKGNAESTYRQGNVDIAPSNLMLENTFAVAVQRANIQAGDTLDVAFGKLAKYCADLHDTAFTGNAINSTQWNGYKLEFLTESEFQELATKDPRTIYFRSKG